MTPSSQNGNDESDVDEVRDVDLRVRGVIADRLQGVVVDRGVEGVLVPVAVVFVIVVAVVVVVVVVVVVGIGVVVDVDVVVVFMVRQAR